MILWFVDNIFKQEGIKGSLSLIESKNLPKYIWNKIYFAKSQSVTFADLFLVQNILRRIKLDFRNTKISKRFANQFKMIIENFTIIQEDNSLPSIEIKLPYHQVPGKDSSLEMFKICLIFSSIEARYRVFTPLSDFINQLTNSSSKSNIRLVCSYFSLYQKALISNFISQKEERTFGKILFDRIIRSRKLCKELDDVDIQSSSSQLNHVKFFVHLKQNHS